MNILTYLLSTEGVRIVKRFLPKTTFHLLDSNTKEHPWIYLPLDTKIDYLLDVSNISSVHLLYIFSYNIFLTDPLVR